MIAILEAFFMGQVGATIPGFLLYSVEYCHILPPGHIL